MLTIYIITSCVVFACAYLNIEQYYTAAECLRYAIFWPIYLVRWFIFNMYLAIHGE